MMKAHYRGFEYAIHSVETEWIWNACPKKVTGLSVIQGTLNGTQSDAMRECLTAIDKALDG